MCIRDRNVSELTAENEAKAATVASQDKALNAAWFVFGTKSELKDQKILEKGDVPVSYTHLGDSIGFRLCVV